MWWEESVVEATVKQSLTNGGWQFLKKPPGVRVDVYAGKGGYKLLMEIKGDVVNPNPEHDPNAHRNKYIQIILGQLLCRTGERQCGYNSNTLLAIGLPDPCKPDPNKGESRFFADYLRDRLAPELKTALKLCVFFVHQDLSVSLEIPDSVEAVLFAAPTQSVKQIGLTIQGITRYTLQPPSHSNPTTTALRNGADLVAFWQTEGLVGTRSDIADSPAEARRLREQAQRRGA